MIAQIPFEDTRKTGYQYGQKIKSPANTYHPGTDANQGNSGGADEGLPVKVMAAGKVVYAKNAGAGWGNLVVIEHPELSKIWPTGYIASRYAHLKTLNVKVGDIVDMTDFVGQCGKTGTTKQSPIASHSHHEVIQKKLPTFTHYPNRKGLDYVKEYWVNPYEFIEKINKLVEGIEVPEYAKADWQEAMKNDFPFKNPNQELTLEQFQEVLKFYGLIKEVGLMPAYRANAAALKIKRLIEGLK